MQAPTGLTLEGRKKLREFVEDQTGLPAGTATNRFADCLEDRHDWSASFCIEIGGFYTRSRNPATITFADADVVHTEIDE
jgi:hypothetical protein